MRLHRLQIAAGERVAQSQELQKLILDQETSVRGFLLTHDPSLLDPYSKAGPRLEETVATLHASLRKDRRSLEILDTLLTYYWNWQTTAALAVRSGGRDEASKSEIIARKLYMDSVRIAIGSLLRGETGTYRHLQHESEQAAERIFWGVIVGTLLLGLAISLTGRRQVKLLGNQYQESLERSDKTKGLLQTTILSIGEGIIVTDADGVVTMMNHVAENLTGWHVSLATGRSVREVFRVLAPLPSDVEGTARGNSAGEAPGLAIGDQTSDPIRGYGEATLISRMGIEVPVERNASPIVNDEGDRIGYVLVFRDVSDRRKVEAEIQRRSREFRALIENAPDLIIRYDRTFRIAYVNPAVESLLGLLPSGLIGKSFKDLGLTDAAYILWEDIIQEVFQTGRGTVIEAELETMRGLRRHQVRLAPEYNEFGEVESVLSVSRDITELKRTEHRLRESEERFRNVMEHSVDGFYLWRAERGTGGVIEDFVLVYLNPQGARLLGRARDELATRRLSSLVTGEELATLLDPWTRALDATEPVVLERGSAPPFIEQRWLRIQALNIGHDTLSLTITDLTERRAMEAQAVLHEQEFRALAHNSPDAIMRYDTECRLLYINPTVEKYLRVPAETIIGKRFSELGFPPEVYHEWEAAVREVIETRSSKLVETAFEISAPRAANGKRDPSNVKALHFEAHVVPEIGPDGTVTSVLSTARDVTRLREALETVRRREEEFKALVENSPDIITRFDKELRAVYINPAISRVLPMTPEERIGKTFEQIGVPEETRLGWEAKLREIFATGKSATIRYSYDAPGEDRRYFEARLVPEFDRAGRVEFVVSTTRDITDSEQAIHELTTREKRLAELTSLIAKNEEQFRTLVEHSLDAFFLFRAVYADLDNTANTEGSESNTGTPSIKDFEIAYVNERAAELTAKQPSQMIGKRLTELYPSEDTLDYVRALTDILQDGTPVVKEYENTSTYVTRGRGSRWLRSQYVPLEGGIMVTTTDITERRAIETRLRTSEARYRELVENLGEAVFSVDIDGRFTFANPYIRGLAGYSAEEVSGLHYTDLVPEPYRDSAKRGFFRQYLAREPHAYMEHPFEAKNGEIRWLALTSTLRFEEGKAVGFDCAATDITKWKVNQPG